jgi:hypothetical protein
MAEFNIEHKKQQTSGHDIVSQRKAVPVLSDHRSQVSQASVLTDNRTTQLAVNSSTKPNNTGLPNQLKTGIESLSGMSMDHVKVHYNSSQPAQLNAHAYAQGSNIHLGPGQEKHLPHEAWHVVQQAQGRVKPTMQMKAGVPVNYDKSLENEADVMGADAERLGTTQIRQTGIVETSGLTSSPSANGLVLQCVGGPKFGLENTGNAADANVQAGIPLLLAAQVAYKAATKATKDAAIATFNGGDTSDHGRQGIYTAALQAAEMTPAGLVAQAGASFALTPANIITYLGTEIARVRLGDLAYVQHAAALGPGLSPVYKRHTLDGPSAKEYVRVNGEHLRRTAHRGITPMERAEYIANQPLTAINAGNLTTGETGYSFHAATGVATPRAHDGDHPNDLEWLNDKARTHLGAIPNNPALLAFLQTRKGVGKGLSATSTGKPITSNHGAAFTGFGNIDIDLARVPIANIMHHYKQAGFTADNVRASMGVGALGHGHAMNWETARANESVTRNREIVLSSIPRAAVTALHDTPERAAYELRFRTLYDTQFTIGYNAAMANSPHNLGPIAAAVPAAYPYRPDHYTAAQADVDFSQAVARAAGATAAAPRLDYANAYAIAFTAANTNSYKLAWINAYENAAWDTPYVANNAAVIEEINTPVAPAAPIAALGVIPAGVGAHAGTIAGTAAGNALGGPAGSLAGAIAGAGYTG